MIPRGIARSHQRKLGIVALVAVGALVLSACSGSGSPEPADDTGGELTTVRVGALPFGFEAVEIAQREGIFEAHGLDVQATYEGAGAVAQITKVVSGELDIASTGSSNVLAARSQGVDVVVSGGVQSAEPENPNSDGLLVPPGSPIQDWEDLEGKTIGIAGLGNVGHVVTNAALEQQGISRDSVSYVQLPNDALVQAGLDGQVDAIVPVTVFHFQATSQGFQPLGGGSSEILPNVPQIVWVASGSYAENNADTLKAFNDAMAEANEIANSNPDLVREIDSELTPLPPAFIEQREIELLNVAIDREAFGEMARYMESFGMLNEPVEIADVVWAEAS